MAAIAQILDSDSEFIFATNDNFHTDKQNSVIALTNATGNPILRRAYGEYGETDAIQMAQEGHPFGYTGRRWFTDLGLYYYRARWYDPELGTFLETDPIGSLDYINLYSYVGLNPLNAADPSGMCTGSRLEDPKGNCASSGGDTTGLDGIQQGMEKKREGKPAPINNNKVNSQKPWYENTDVGKSWVANYSNTVDEAAMNMDFGDKKLVYAIIYMETSHGNYESLGMISDSLGLSKSYLPMNVNYSYWGNILGSKSEIRSPMGNVVAGMKIIKGIQTIYPCASIAQTATLYNNINATSISNYGARVQAIYEQELWKY